MDTTDGHRLLAFFAEKRSGSQTIVANEGMHCESQDIYLTSVVIGERILPLLLFLSFVYFRAPSYLSETGNSSRSRSV